jgi:hypothetical protein
MQVVSREGYEVLTVISIVIANVREPGCRSPYRD